MANVTSNGKNGGAWLKAWRSAMAGLMVAVAVGFWNAGIEFAGLSEAVDGLKASVEKIDDRVLYLERNLSAYGQPR